ncbi:hypothetical protein ACJMK2_021902 [Sinanodonta woodiana]|uniref:VWFD domain-containing protein n=1 Tax=Sinanodonta woodiana TaxID=1069815 RepID=A0ABD3TJ97_SINWO
MDISFALKFLSINIRVSPSLVENRTLRGLLGNMDNDKTNDLVQPSGYILPANSNESTIFRNFGELWRTNVNNSLFVYENGDSHATYQNTSFVPIFKDSYSPTQVTAAEDKCGGQDQVACVYDYLTTNDTLFAENTRDTNETFTVSSALAGTRCVCLAEPRP